MPSREELLQILEAHVKWCSSQEGGKRAYLKGARMNWQSHDLIAELLRREAGEDIDRRSLAGLILLSRDWCWDRFLALSHPQREWALEDK